MKRPFCPRFCSGLSEALGLLGIVWRVFFGFHGLRYSCIAVHNRGAKHVGVR